MDLYNVMLRLKLFIFNLLINRFKTYNYFFKKKQLSKNMIEFKTLLVPGGLGFIGSHTIVQLLQNTDVKLIIIDDMSNCFPDVLPRIKTIALERMTEQQFNKRVEFYQVNILDLSGLERVFQMCKQRGEPIQGIMHFAALKSVNQSFEKPILYYENNVVGSMNLFKMMQKYPECKNFIFSSTAAVYGALDNCTQTSQKNPDSPYGESKVVVEMLLSSLAKQHKDWRIIVLRYFNPCGAHKSGLLGDQPSQYPNNLFPCIQQVILGKRQKFNIFGNDYPTPDGTCIRDFIHICDLASGHLYALNKLKNMTNNFEIYNLGSGVGHSVYEVVKGYEQALGHSFNWSFAARRPGDLIQLVANPSKANKQLGWRTQKTVKDMCVDSLNFVRTRLMKKE